MLAIPYWARSLAGVLFNPAHLSVVEDQGRYVGGPDTFGSFEARRFRHAFFWALYQNTPYDRDTHSWANSRIAKKGQYRHIRGTNTPAYRLAEAYATHIYNGRLDMAAGDGKATPSAIPILTANEAIRPAIARLWRDSVWGVNKAIWCRTGTVTGDAPLVLSENVRKARVEVEVLDPSCLRHVTHDHQGNVQGYIRQEYRPNPEYRPPRRFAREAGLDPEAPSARKEFVVYTEACYREGETVHYETYKGEGAEMVPYNWRGEDADGDALPPSWEADYGFIPMVICPHIKVRPDLCWGWGEYNALLAKIDEANDLGSKLHDQIRKVVEGMWFFAGVQDPQRKLNKQGDAPSAADPMPGRQEITAFYAPTVGATAASLVIPLDIQFASIEILNQVAEIERDNPVLRFDRARSMVSGDASAKALREIRKPAEAVIQERRAGYDDALVRVHKMALSIGALRGYDAYAGLPVDGYEAGAFDHAIGDRTVYGVDPLDQAELDLARANAVVAWRSAGVPPRMALEMSGWSEDQLAQFDDESAAQEAKALEAATKMAALAPKPAPGQARTPDGTRTPASSERPAKAPAA